MSTRTQNLGLFKYDTVNDAALPFDLNVALNDNWDILDNLGSGRNIGEIVTSTIPLTDAGLHLLDGALIQGDGIYSDFYNYIVSLYEDYPQIFTDESGWQQNVQNFGVCGKFVFNTTSRTVRLPKITGIIEGTTDVTALGNLVQAGLPNITGTASLHAVEQANIFQTVNGAFIGTGGNSNNYRTPGNLGVNSGALSYGGITLNASRSSSIYGNSSTVQPQTIKAFYYIVIATSIKTDIQIDIDEIATDLNSKVSTGDLVEVKCVIETYQNGTSWYRVYSDGWCEQGGISPSAGDQTNNTIGLLKKYKDTNYSLLFAQNAGVEGSYTNGCTAKNKTTSSFVLVYRTGGTASFYWQACGYIR